MLRRERYLIFLTKRGIIIMPCFPFGKSVTLIKRIEAIYVIDSFFADTPDDNSSCMKSNVLSLFLFYLDQITNI